MTENKSKPKVMDINDIKAYLGKSYNKGEKTKSLYDRASYLSDVLINLMDVTSDEDTFDIINNINTHVSDYLDYESDENYITIPHVILVDKSVVIKESDVSKYTIERVLINNKFKYKNKKNTLYIYLS